MPLNVSKVTRSGRAFTGKHVFLQGHEIEKDSGREGKYSPDDPEEPHKYHIMSGIVEVAHPETKNKR